MELIKNIGFVKKLRKKRFEKHFSLDKGVNYFRGVYPNFSDALASAPKTKPTGYDNDFSAKMYKERIGKVYSTDFPVLYWLKALEGNYSNVFDFGGHIGLHYYSYQNYLDFNKIKSWTVCDVKAVCDEGSKYSKENDKECKLSFTTDIENAKGKDIFLAKGSLQYIDWEIAERIKNFETLPKYVLINTIPTHKKFKTITLNSIGTSYCPYYIRKEDDFISQFLSIGYKLKDTWQHDDKACKIAFEPERSLNYYMGYLFELK